MTLEFSRVEILGLVSAALTTGSFIPQAVNLWFSHRPVPAKDVSGLMFFMMTAGLAGWLTYGICIHSLSVTVANAVALPVALLILVYKGKYG